MSDILELTKDYIIKIMGITKEEFNNIFAASYNVSTPGDCKIALVHAIRANRVLSQMKAAAKARTAAREEVLVTDTATIKNKIYRYIRDIKDGKYPLDDKEMIKESLKSYLDATKWGDDDNPELKIDVASPPLWSEFRVKNITNIEQMPFTSIAISTITDCDVMSATATQIKEVSADAARRAMLAKIGEANIHADKALLAAVTELLDGIRKELSALGSSAQIISSEQYGMNRSQRMEQS